MGHPPEDDFVAGAQCLAFEGVFGESSTPLTVKVVFENIIICPPYPNPPVNGTFLLTQTGNPCIWQNVGGPGNIVWTLVMAGAISYIDNLLPRGAWFGALGLLDNYVNANICPGSAGHQGTGVITWGPEIPKL